jgi:predicted MFS family arabinose efflux permease
MVPFGPAPTLRPGVPIPGLLRFGPVRALAGSGCVGQLTQTAAPLGLLLLGQQVTGSLAGAGAVSAAFGLGACLGRPLQGSLIDRRGPAPVLALATSLHTSALAAGIAVVLAEGPGLALVAASAAAGAALPAISQSQRVVLARAAPGRRESSYALIIVTQELSMLLGPAVLGGLLAVASPQLALAATGAIAACGTLWLASQPLVRACEGSPRGPAHGARFPIQATALILATLMLLGAGLGAAELAVPAFAIEHERRSVSGLLLTALSIGGVVGVALSAGLGQRTSISLRAVALLGCLATGFAALALAPSIIAMAILLIAAGLPLTSAHNSLYLLLDDHTPAWAIARVFGWSSAAFAAGGTVGTALAGALCERAGAAAGFLEASALVLAAALLLLGGRHRLRRRRSERMP